MAGAGYKLFNTGDVLTAAQVNTYLQEQTVMVFASSTARTTALSGVLAEGMMSYLQDTNAVEVYDGSAWVGVATGDITGVTAGTGLTGGGTSGSVTVSLDIPVTEVRGGTNQTTYTTGDVLYASGTNTLAKRAIGTTGQVLTVSGGVPTWATPAGGGGKVLQVVSGTYATQVTCTSSTYIDTGLTASITPSANSSQILVLIAQSVQQDGDATGEIKIRMFRGATQLGTDQPLLYTGQNTFKSAFFSACYLDSPSSTSSLTYKTQFNSTAGNTRVNIGGGTSQITLLEIGA